MIAGRLTETILLQEIATVVGDFGEHKTIYYNRDTVRAEAKWRSGNLSNEASEVFDAAGIEFLIYDAYQVAPRWRVRYAGETYTVTAVQRMRKKNLKRLICEKVNE